MEIVNGLLEVVAGMAETYADLSDTIHIGPLLTTASISVYPDDDDADSSVFLNKKRLFTVPLLFLRKSQDQQACITELDNICSSLASVTSYTQASGFELIDISVKKPPYYKEKDEDGYYIYGAKVLCRVYG